MLMYGKNFKEVLVPKEEREILTLKYTKKLWRKNLEL